jgi:hypothetical protein
MSVKAHMFYNQNTTAISGKYGHEITFLCISSVDHLASKPWGPSEQC